MKAILLTFLLISIFNFSYSQPTPENITKKFFEIYHQDDTGKALDFLFSYSPYVKDIQDVIDEVKQKLKTTVNKIGKYYGFDLLTKRSAGPNVIMLTYLVRHDREPLTFNIMFYKPNDAWQMQNFKYGNTTDDELEEASKAYRMKENYE
jgi:hypothetical protein